MVNYLDKMDFNLVDFKKIKNYQNLLLIINNLLEIQKKIQKVLQLNDLVNIHDYFDELQVKDIEIFVESTVEDKMVLVVEVFIKIGNKTLKGIGKNVEDIEQKLVLKDL